MQVGVLRGKIQCVGVSGVLGGASTGRLKVWSPWICMCAAVTAAVSCCRTCSGVGVVEGVVVGAVGEGSAGGVRSGRSTWSACVMGRGVGTRRAGVGFVQSGSGSSQVSS